MPDVLREVAERLETARSSRKKGDALRGIGRNEGAREAYAAGVAALTNALNVLSPDALRIDKLSVPEAYQKNVINELVEVYGTLGGLYQRLDSIEEAAENYQLGARLEEQFALPSTYNRLNAVKNRLLAGKARLRELEPQIRHLADIIDRQLRDATRGGGDGDGGWAWADLGDCLALLDDVDAARRAYATFIAKAETKAPERTLQVLKEIEASLRHSGDPDAGRLDSAIDFFERQLV
jgi:tetratricopeptide (TPR) repeat protein